MYKIYELLLFTNLFQPLTPSAGEISDDMRNVSECAGYTKKYTSSNREALCEKVLAVFCCFSLTGCHIFLLMYRFFYTIEKFDCINGRCRRLCKNFLYTRYLNI